MLTLVNSCSWFQDLEDKASFLLDWITFRMNLLFLCFFFKERTFGRHFGLELFILIYAKEGKLLLGFCRAFFLKGFLYTFEVLEEEQ